MQGIDWQTIFGFVTAVASLVAVGGVIAAFRQARLAAKGIKAQTLMKLIDEWRSNELYQSVMYVHDLRQEWKRSQPDLSQWPNLAREWVVSHAGKKSDSPDSTEKQLANEWMKRRMASQFFSKMGLLVAEGYLKADDLFGVVPEVGRFLVVLGPIEYAIQEYWREQEKNPCADWDRAFGKWEFNDLWARFREWYPKHSEMLEKHLSLESLKSPDL